VVCAQALLALFVMVWLHCTSRFCRSSFRSLWMSLMLHAVAEWRLKSMLMQLQ